jgi:hypothetical protein
MRYILFILLLISGTINAQQKNFSITPAPSWLIPYHPDLEKKADPREVRDGYYALLFEEQDNAEQHAVYHHIIRQIVNEAGIQNGAEISVDYDPAYEKLHFHQIIIHRNGHVINKLQASRFKFLQQEEELSRFIYSGLYTAYFLMEDIRKGDQIEFAYTVEGNNPIFENKYSNSFYFATSDPIANYYECLITAPSRDIRFKSFNDAQLPKTQLLNGMKVYEWKITDLKPLDDKRNTPGWYNGYPFVQASEYKTWKEVVDWGCRINTIPAAGAALQARIAELKKESGEDKERYFQKAVRFVQDDIRYMGIEMGEYSHRPNTPDKILAQRFGDCKDKSLLLATLLNANGIPASMAYTNTDDKQYVENYLPAPDLFNHAIVYATFNGKGMWIDPTFSYQRGNITSLAIPDYKKALIITPSSTGLSTVANESHGMLRIVEAFTLPATNNGKGTLRVTSHYTGEFADNQRASMANSSAKDDERAYLDYYKKNYSGITIDSAMIVTDTDAINSFETVERYLISKPWEADSTKPGRITFNVYAGILRHILPAYADEGKMDAPLALRYPYKLDYTIRLEMPEDWTFEEPALHLKNPCYKLDFKLVTRGRFVILHYNFETFQDNIPATYLNTYISDRKKIDDILSYNLYWNSSSAVEEDTTPVQPGSSNWLAIGLALIVAAVCAMEARRFYRRSHHPIHARLISHPINGWLVFIAIFTFLRPLILSFQFFGAGFFDNNTWQALGRLPNTTNNLSVLQLIFCVEVMGNVFFLVYSVLLVFLFYKKRDSFPIATVYFLLVNLVFVFADTMVAHFIHKQMAFDEGTLKDLLQAFIAGAIWTPYLLRSEQVKETFIMPHDSELG